MGAQPDTSTSAPEVWHGVPQILAPIFVARLLDTYLVVGPLAYVALVLLLRISGKRTLTKLNAFDLVITVALGSMLATILLNKSVLLGEGVLGLAVLIALQFVITWTSVRYPWVQGVVKAEPTL